MDRRPVLTRCDICLSAGLGGREAGSLDQKVRHIAQVRMLDLLSIDWTGGTNIEL